MVSPLKNEEKLRLVEAGVSDMKTSLTNAISGLSHSVDMLTVEIRCMSQNFQKAVPVKLVIIMFMILIATLFGVGAIKVFFSWLGVAI